MKKICVILTALFGSMALSATAAPLTENKAALPQQCTQLFKETEKCGQNYANFFHCKSLQISPNIIRLKNSKILQPCLVIILSIFFK